MREDIQSSKEAKGLLIVHPKGREHGPHIIAYGPTFMLGSQPRSSTYTSSETLFAVPTTLVNLGVPQTAN